MHAAVTASRHGPSVSVACKAVSRRRACASEGAAHCSRPAHGDGGFIGRDVLSWQRLAAAAAAIAGLDPCRGASRAP